jgi:hypothetical protein
MTLSLLPQIGAVAGWKLELTPAAVGGSAGRGKTTRFSSEQYRGSVEATLVSGLAAGSYSIVVEDVSDDDFQELTRLAHGADPLEARLYLFWTDVPIAKLAGDGLIAVLRVTGLRRRPGKWRYEMVVEGREWVYDRVMLPCPALSAKGPVAAAADIARELGIELSPPPTPVITDEVRTTDPKLKAIDELRQLETAMVSQAAKAKPPRPRAGLGMYLIRDGKLQLGPDRLRVLPGRPVLDAGTGLLFLERNGAVREDETAVTAEDKDPPRRDLFVATLRGRPDLKPGVVVDFTAPEQGAMGEALGFALGPAPQIAAGKTVTAYVQEVSHRLSREQGFLTVARCVAAASGVGDLNLVERLWFDGTTPDAASGGASGETFLVRLFDRARDGARPDRWPDIAQVRAIHLGAEGQEPAQTEKLWRGLEVHDGQVYAAARQPYAKEKKELGSAPYLTPFAYANCGLVLPRYPGTRVLLVNRGGDPSDPVDVGALWGRGAAPNAAEVGDWWLILPVDLDGDQAAVGSIADGEEGLAKRTDFATNDLTDARGNRVIEVGKLTIRIGKDHLLPPGVRPEVASDPVTIEHAGGNARIVIAQDGSITIESAKTVTIKGTEGIALETTKDITLTAGGHVDVKKGT